MSDVRSQRQVARDEDRAYRKDMDRFMEFHGLPKPSRSSRGSLGAVFASPEHVVVVRPATINGSRPLEHPPEATENDSPVND